MLSKDEVMEIFAETGGVLSGHFKLTSGRHSDTYMQCAKLFVQPQKSELLCKNLAFKVVSSGMKIDMVASPAIGGIIMGYEMARWIGSGVPNVFFERENGEMTLRRGFNIERGTSVLVVEDVVTTGGSVKEVIAKVLEMGGKVAGVASIVDRSNGKVDFGFPYFNLVSLDVVSFDESECPLCKKGLPIVKPGSRT